MTAWVSVGNHFRDKKNAGLKERLPIHWREGMDMAKDFLIIGHRGSTGKKIENTIESFEEALQVDKANALETDLCLTNDGQIILWHDWDPNEKIAIARELGLEKYNRYRPAPPFSVLRKPTCELPMETIKNNYSFVQKATNKKEPFQIATFGEFVKWGKNQETLKYVFLDIKIPLENLNLVSTMMRQIRGVLDANAPMFKFIFLTPYKRILQEIKKCAPQYEKYCSLDVEIPPAVGIGPGGNAPCYRFSAVQAAIDCQNHYASIGRPPFMYFIAVNNPDDFLYDSSEIFCKTITEDVKLMNEHNENPGATLIEKLIGWTINEEDDMENLIRLGIHGIVSDRPNVLYRKADALGIV
jgi:glycerophosphoryl diester phosphodiesterase